MALKKLWVEKYRPTTLDQYIFQNPAHAAAIELYIQQKSIPNILLSGVQGTGKTTLARILMNSLDVDENDILVINASDERGIDVFRDKVKNFATTSAMGEFKIIHLEEGDKLTPDAQKALKSFTEDMSDYCRFIITCNQVNLINAPLRSRFVEFAFKAPPADDIAEYLVRVLATEKVKFDLDLLDKYIAFGYPDIRKILMKIESGVVNRVLQEPLIEGRGGDYKFELLDLLNADKWEEARQLACSTIPEDEWTELFSFMYQNMHKIKKFKDKKLWEQAIILLANYQDMASRVASQELNGAAMFIKLTMIK